jgi:phage shock protein PspC (stress-responsive transcriptional regulator)
MSDIKLRKSRTNKMLTGVCGGIGESFGIDPTIIRLVWAILTVFAGTGLLLYILAAIIIPEDDDIV